MKDFIQSFHRAAQYSVAVCNSYLPHESDDSQSTMYWDQASKSLVSREILGSQTFAISLSHEDFTLNFSGSDDKLILEGKTHDGILSWIREQLEKCGLDSSTLSFTRNYDYPYSGQEEASLEAPSQEDRDFMSEIRTTANSVLNRYAEQYESASEVLVWPHHFDTGLLVELPKIGIGLGLAIPDSLVDSIYYYVSGYTPEGPVSVKDFGSLERGVWGPKEWNGAALPALDVFGDDALAFMNEATSALISHVQFGF